MRGLVCVLLLSLSPLIYGWEVSHELSEEVRWYPQSAAFSNQADYALTTTWKTDITQSWDDDRKVISVMPYLRFSTPDEVV